MATRTIEITASSMSELQQQLPDIVLQPGSVGRLEIFAPRVAGLCAIPLGSLMMTPVVGQLFAEQLAPTTAIVTDHGGLGAGAFQCDAFLEWAIPVGFQQPGQTNLALAVGLIAVAAAIGFALAALGWSIAQLRLLVQAVVDALPGGLGGGLLFLIAGAVALIGLGQFRGRR